MTAWRQFAEQLLRIVPTSRWYSECLAEHLEHKNNRFDVLCWFVTNMRRDRDNRRNMALEDNAENQMVSPSELQ